jgi:hypothetical protein
MNQQSSSKTTAIVFIIILAIGGLWYFYTTGTPSDDSISSVDINIPAGGSDSGAVGSRALVLLREISSLKIDPDFFKGAVYKSLLDYSVEVPTQNVGRPNPFQPFPGQSQTSSTKSITPKSR